MTHAARDRLLISVEIFIVSMQVLHKYIFEKEKKKKSSMIAQSGKRNNHRAHDIIVSILFCQTNFNN